MGSHDGGNLLPWGSRVKGFGATPSPLQVTTERQATPRDAARLFAVL
jgi:hypothetical protein